MKKMKLLVCILTVCAISALNGQEQALDGDFEIPESGIEMAYSPVIVTEGDLSVRQTEVKSGSGLNEQLGEIGIEIGQSLTNVYQANVRGGSSTHDHDGRYNGSYSIEITADLNTLLGFGSGSLFMSAGGSWPDAEGIDGSSVGSFSGVNASAGGDRAMDIDQVFYEGPIGENFNVIIGKVDIGGVFDGVNYASDEGTQFLNGAFVGNLAIPFSDPGLGIVLSANLTDWWYAMGGVADAQADVRETGFRTTFGGEDYFLYMFETGIESELESARGYMPVVLRAGMWYDPQPKERFSNGENKRDDVGFYLSYDQMLYRESSEEEDSQGLGVFARYGVADSDVSELSTFWSVGAQYQGLISGRDDDVLGLGLAQTVFTDQDNAGFTEDAETVLEFYYNAAVAASDAIELNISPSLQYISGTGGDKANNDSLVFAVRAQINF